MLTWTVAPTVLEWDLKGDCCSTTCNVHATRSHERAWKSHRTSLNIKEHAHITAGDSAARTQYLDEVQGCTRTKQDSSYSESKHDMPIMLTGMRPVNKLSCRILWHHQFLPHVCYLYFISEVMNTYHFAVTHDHYLCQCKSRNIRDVQ